MFTEEQKKMIAHAYTSVPFYMTMARERGLDHNEFNDWSDMPTIEKADLVLHNDSFLSAKYLSLYGQEELLQVHTSGSNGKCAKVYWDIKECRRSLLPLWLRRKKYYGIGAHDKYCYFFTSRFAGGRDVEREDKGYALGFCKSNLNDDKLVGIWNEMCDFEPIWLNLQPSMAMLLCRVIEKYKLSKISTLRYIEMTGEMLFSENRQYIEKIMGAIVVNQYGSIEMNSLAFECPKGHLHCLEKNVHIEILGNEGEEVPIGEEGEIYVTTLTNYAMPLIRYRLGDRGRFSPVQCECGEHGKVLELTTGRSNDYVIDKEGNLINAYIFVRCVENVNNIYEHTILQFQVIQHDINDFTINLVLDDEQEQDKICACFMENLWQSSLEGAKFRIHVFSKLLPDEKNGKLRWFVNEMDVGKDNLNLLHQKLIR